MFYSHDGNTQRRSFGKDALSYTVDVLGGVNYQFHVRAVTVKPGPNATSTVNVPEYSESCFLFQYILWIQLLLTDRHLVPKCKRHNFGL